ncbi:actin cortical patch SUR7/pH-response regulator pali [Phaeosphaeriaceae sp. PMI808]|nr:actin cortical patch SUR7/pH-response regulator pali [Phaeosphaeriaceae sp. PMI808]
MRPTALVPVLCCTAALILSFLCLFAGHKQGFMEDYHLLTLNTSLLGETLLEENKTSSNPITNLLDKIPNYINQQINDKIEQVKDKIGVQDWYSAHMLNFCDGQYTPAEVANATVSENQISKAVMNCSESQAMYQFNPTAIIQDALNKTTKGKVTLKDIKWPEDIDDGIRALNAVMAAMFVLYVLSICLIFVALIAAVAAIIASGRLSACLNGIVALSALLAIGIASALVTAMSSKATETINKYGNDVGLEAKKGGKFLALTWSATALMFIVFVVWMVEVCVGRRQTKRTTYAKHG